MLAVAAPLGLGCAGTPAGEAGAAESRLNLKFKQAGVVCAPGGGPLPGLLLLTLALLAGSRRRP